MSPVSTPSENVETVPTRETSGYNNLVKPCRSNKFAYLLIPPMGGWEPDPILKNEQGRQAVKGKEAGRRAVAAVEAVAVVTTSERM